jgi:hypothetical protein
MRGTGGRLRALPAAGVLVLAVVWLGLAAAPAAAATGSISGKVTAAETHAPLAGIEVCAVTAKIFTTEFEKEIEEGVEPGSEQLACTLTQAGGEYTISGLAAESFLVGFSNPFLGSLDYITQYYKEKTTFEASTPVAVTAGSTTSGINAELQEGAELSGTITSASTGAAIEGAIVCASPTPRPSTREGGCARSGAGGAFSVLGLEAGGYTVLTFAPGFEFGVYGGATPSEAATITLAAKEHHGGINFTLKTESGSPGGPLGGGGSEPGGGGLPGETGGSTHTAAPVSGVGLANAFVQEHRRRSLVVRLTCNSSRRCSGEITLTATRHLKRAGKRISKTVAIGSAHFSAQSDHGFAVQVRLTRVGRSLLGRAQKDLVANLKIVQKAPTPAQTTVKRVLLVGKHAAAKHGARQAQALSDAGR